MTSYEVAARTVWGEARGEGLEGMLAVAWVLRNRTERSGRWPNTLTEVCLQPKQFSCWNANDPNRARCFEVDLRNPQYQTALFVVLGVIRGHLSDPTSGADHYHNKNISPSWAKGMQEVAKIGSHIFYKE